jgi:hypothetical protein
MSGDRAPAPDRAQPAQAMTRRECLCACKMHLDDLTREHGEPIVDRAACEEPAAETNSNIVEGRR